MAANSVLTDEIKSEIQYRHAQGVEIDEIARLAGVKADTLKKAVREGRIVLLPRPAAALTAVTAITKTERSIADDAPGMGKACTHGSERVLAALKGETATPVFGDNTDVGCAGILFSLPALDANGLLRHSGKFKPDGGYYSVESIFLSLAFLALLRAKTLAQSETMPCGELGKAIGLDRIPEVKTLRQRIGTFCGRTDVKGWALGLSKEWMGQDPELAGVFYVDGHVNVYSGDGTEMPKRYVSRLRLCMSGSTDFWVNAHTGQPFFVVNSAIHSGMAKQLRENIIPRLNKDVPNQPTEDELKGNPLLSKYMVVCDREGSSPELAYDLWQDRVALCTYKKNVADKWDEAEFMPYEEVRADGEKLKVKMAERGVLLKNKDGKKQIWCREIRKLSESGHQTSIITTNYLMRAVLVGFYMFARWSQEIFFKYMMEHFDIDGLVSYKKEAVSDTAVLVNPAYRKLENDIKKENAKLARRKAEFTSVTLKEQDANDISNFVVSKDGAVAIKASKQVANTMEKYIKKKADLLEEVGQLSEAISELKEKRKATERKITFAQLPEDQKFTNAINDRKHLMDTVKIIAYRAETAMSNIINKHMKHPDEARKLIREVFKTDANIKADYENKTLTVSLHKLNHRKDDIVIEILCKELNDTNTIFPGTDLLIIYKMVST